jgi:hypothetical protein
MLKKLVGPKESELYFAIAVGLYKAEKFQCSLYSLEGQCTFTDDAIT